MRGWGWVGWRQKGLPRKTPGAGNTVFMAVFTHAALDLRTRVSAEQKMGGKHKEQENKHYRGVNTETRGQTVVAVSTFGVYI